MASQSTDQKTYTQKELDSQKAFGIRTGVASGIIVMSVILLLEKSILTI